MGFCTGTPQTSALRFRRMAGSSAAAWCSGPAANAGIRAGDVILEVNRQPVKDVAGLRQIVDKHAKGTPMVMLVQRQNTTMYVAV